MAVLEGNHQENELGRFSDAERRAWMADQPLMKSDVAHKLFQNHPRYDGTKQHEFRKEWKEIKGTTRGRPRLKS